MRFRDAYKNIESKFTSGNSIPVERTVITKEEWDAINKVILELEEWLKADQEAAKMIRECKEDPDCKAAIDYLSNH